MGITVTAPTFDAEKHDYVYAEGETLAAIAADALVLWIGDDYTPFRDEAKKQGDLVLPLRNLRPALQKADYPTPGPGEVAKAVMTYPGGDENIVVTPDAAFIAPTEAEIAVIYGESAQLSLGQSVARQIADCIGKYFTEYPKYRKRRAVA